MDQPSLILPTVDEWKYRVITLENGITALLVSDVEADKAAASMDVEVGSMADPEHLPGLAHFTEHMLFYASAKFPTEDEYSKWVSEHGGSTNAWTSPEHTNYQFSVNWDHLESTLDRFAQFFIEPLISADGIARERQAVDSEHSKNMQSDGWRQMQLWHEVAHPSSHYSRFFTGSLETLGTTPEAAGIDVREELAAFYEREYSANRMKLCIVGRESVEELETVARRLFSPVVDKGLPTRAPHEGDPFPASHRGHLIRAVPVNSGHHLRLRWLIPPLDALWAEDPAGFLGYMIGHEGKGSLFSLLKDAGWAKSLVAGGHAELRGLSTFSISISLTDAGNENVEAVLKAVYQYIALLRTPAGVTAALYNDNAALRRLGFNFRNVPEAAAYATSLAHNMHTYPMPHLLELAAGVPLKFDEAVVRATLDALTVDNMLCMWVSHEHSAEGMATERWYGQQYDKSALPESWLATLRDLGTDDRLELPSVNPFTPTELALLAAEQHTGSEDDAEPQRVVDDAFVRMLYKTHLQFKAPKAFLELRFLLPGTASSLDNVLCSALVSHLIADDLTEVGYDAELAGLDWGLRSTAESSFPGFSLQVAGYTHKLPILLDEVLARLRSFTVRADRFAVVKEKFVEFYKNWDQQQPYAWCTRLADEALQAGRYSIDAQRDRVPALSAATVQHFLDSAAFTSGRVEGLLIGNVAAADARAAAAAAASVLSDRGAVAVSAAEFERWRTVQLPSDSVVAIDMVARHADERNSAHYSMWQGFAQSCVTEQALALLTADMLHTPAFHQLRTVEQIGYMVYSFEASRAGVPHLAFLLQSTVLGGGEIEARVDAFLRQWLASLAEELTEEAFAERVDELAKSQLRKPLKLSTLASRWMTEILVARFDFQRRRTVVAALRALSRSDLLAYVQRVFGDGLAKRRIVVSIAGADERERAAGTAGTVAEGERDDTATCGSNGAAQGGAAAVCDGAGASSGDGQALTGAAAEGSGACEAAPNGKAAEDAVCGAGGKSGGGAPAEAARVVVAPEACAEFRLGRTLWPMTRRQWL